MMIKAIETQYKGYRFRSRLEARWAVFFDALGIKWEYEFEGYNLGRLGWYLPDFWLPQVRMWAEVKPCRFTQIEKRRSLRLSIITGRECLMLPGMPKNVRYLAAGRFGSSYCLTCYHGYPVDEGRFYGNPGCDCDPNTDDGCEYCSFDDTEEAVLAARAARFEHGETW